MVLNFPDKPFLQVDYKIRLHKEFLESTQIVTKSLESSKHKPEIIKLSYQYSVKLNFLICLTVNFSPSHCLSKLSDSVKEVFSRCFCSKHAYYDHVQTLPDSGGRGLRAVLY